MHRALVQHLERVAAVDRQANIGHGRAQVVLVRAGAKPLRRVVEVEHGNAARLGEQQRVNLEPRAGRRKYADIGQRALAVAVLRGAFNARDHGAGVGQESSLSKR